MRTRAEVRAFLDSQVGTTVHDKILSDLDGQCVTLIKALLEFLGVPNPYAARGNARDAGDTYIAQGIGTPGKGWLTVVVNRDMGRVYEPSLRKYVNYGHIWIDLINEANYEENGAIALHVTKYTRPISQGQQFINLDQWIRGDEYIMNEGDANALFFAAYHRQPGGNEAKQWIGKTPREVAESIPAQPEWLTDNHYIIFFKEREKQLNDALAALNDANQKLQDVLKDDTLDKQAVVDAQKAAQDAADKLNDITVLYQQAKEELEAANGREQKATATGNAFTRWIGEQLNKFLGGK